MRHKAQFPHSGAAAPPTRRPLSPAADCACDDVYASNRALQSAPGAYYTQPCVLPAPSGTFAKCASFYDTGRCASAGIVLCAPRMRAQPPFGHAAGPRQRGTRGPISPICHATLSSLAPAGGTRWRAPASRRGPATQSCGMARSRSMCWTTSAQASHRLSAPQAAPPAPLVSGGGGRTEWGPELPQRRPCSQAQPHSLGCVDHAHPCLPAPSFAAAPLCSGLSQLFCAFCDPAGGRPTLCVAKGGVACRHVVNVSCAGGCPVAA